MDLADRGWTVTAWQLLSRWAVPVMMSLAYVFLAVTSETDATGEAYMAAGLGLVLIVWFVFRALTDSASLARWISVGDTARLLAPRRLPRRADARAAVRVGRAFAHLLRAEHAEALAALDPVEPPALAPLATVIRLGALIELGRPAEEVAAAAGSLTASSSNAAAGAVGASAAAVAARAGQSLRWLAEAQLAMRAGQSDQALQLLTRIIDDIRAGTAVRAIAHSYAARLADQRGDRAEAARHRAAAAAMAAPDARWLRG
jgi:hypothetical protein